MTMQLWIAGVGASISVAISAALFLLPPPVGSEDIWFPVGLFILSVVVPIWAVSVSLDLGSTRKQPASPETGTCNTY